MGSGGTGGGAAGSVLLGLMVRTAARSGSPTGTSAPQLTQIRPLRLMPSQTRQRQTGPSGFIRLADRRVGRQASRRGLTPTLALLGRRRRPGWSGPNRPRRPGARESEHVPEQAGRETELPPTHPRPPFQEMPAPPHRSLRRLIPWPRHEITMVIAAAPTPGAPSRRRRAPETQCAPGW